ncbi:MAG TPA: preprotein translocase subunit SecE [Fulvivirga sp.]|nr:preprotein translocase subunit SecE [Fulvivirga sp.]
MHKLKTFILESYDEMKNKVSWPKYSELQNSSILVLIASLIFSLLIGLIDYVFQTGMDWFYGAF